ncbi:DUF2059 domain-containing protein [Burkholderia cepacia]|uniref:DUF2059 domain-containing protein n=1 Tax=Burkholderia cepacia TaxID=292 RepID=UPI0009BE2CBD|nr:DUF2059 domain-containing protein [Burkholderia cepacia]
MKNIVILTMTAFVASCLFCSPAYAQFRGFDDWNRSGDRRTLCRQSIKLAGVEDDMDQRIREIVRNSYDAIQRRPGMRSSTDADSYSEVLGETLNDAKDPILRQLLESCARNFTISELRGVNDFYMSPAGQAWLRKGRGLIMPEMERAISNIQPRINETIERRYRERIMN